MAEGGSPEASRIAAIEYLRGLAALSVAWFHLTNAYSGGWVRQSGAWGWLGVEVFFVVSGFVIPLSIARSYRQYSVRCFPHFMAKRILRLEPPYIASIVLVVILWELSHLAPMFRGSAPSWTAAQLLSHLFYLIPLTTDSWLQPVYWSLAWEFVFYIVIGLLYPIVGREDGHDTFWYLAVVAVISLVVWFGLPARALLFIMGIAVYRNSVSERTGRRKLWNLAFVAIPGMVIATSNLSVAVVGVGAACVIHRYAGVPSARLRTLHQPLMKLGGMSYALYLTHVPIGGRIVNLGRRYIEGPLSELLLSVIAVMCCLVFAHMFSSLIETPSIALARRVTGAARS